MHVDQSSLILNVLISETNGRAETTERPMQYPERRVSDSSDSGILIRNNSTMVTKIEYIRVLANITIDNMFMFWGSSILTFDSVSYAKIHS